MVHISTINRVINFPTVSSGYSELYCRSKRDWKIGWRGERELQKNDAVEWSGRLSSGGYINRLECGATHAPLTCSGTSCLAGLLKGVVKKSKFLTLKIQILDSRTQQKIAFQCN